MPDITASTTIRLNEQELRAVLPHQGNFVQIHEVFDLIPGHSGKAKKFIDPADPIFACHFPGEPIYPGIFLIETVAQLAYVVFSYREGDSQISPESRTSGYLGTIKKFTFSDKVLPGDELTVSVKVSATLGPLAKVDAAIYKNNAEVVAGELYFSLGDAK